jgi:hypothetical protein
MNVTLTISKEELAIVTILTVVSSWSRIEFRTTAILHTEVHTVAVSNTFHSLEYNICEERKSICELSKINVSNNYLDIE